MNKEHKKYFIGQREFAEETLVQLLHHIEKKGRRDTKNELTIVVLLNLKNKHKPEPIHLRERTAQ